MRIQNTPRWGIILILLAFLVAGCASSTAQGAGILTPTVPKAGTVVSAPVATTGCGKTAPVAPGTTASFTLTSGGLKRSYLLHVPTGYDTRQMIPLVLNIHGLNEMAQTQEAYTQYSVLADQQHFVVVYPQGVVGPKGKVGWATYGKIDPKVNDVLFFSDLLNVLQERLCLDPHRIYATGISNGGGMANVLACQLAGRIAAFATVAAAIYPIPGGCHPTRPVAYLEFHGTDDPVVHYNGVLIGNIAPIMQTMQAWAVQDGCASTPTTFAHQADVTGLQWGKCQNEVLVEHYRIEGGGHTWPGATLPTPKFGKTTQTISATALSWRFFEHYHLP